MSIWRNVPLRAKIGVFLFGFFALVAMFGPIFELFNRDSRTRTRSSR